MGNKLQLLSEFIREEIRYLIYEQENLNPTKNEVFEISKEDLMKSIIDSKGKVFTITFIKRGDGTQRVLTGRMGVKSYLKGGVLPYNPSEKRLIIIFDMVKRAYRAIPFDNITSFKYQNKTWIVKK